MILFSSSKNVCHTCSMPLHRFSANIQFSFHFVSCCIVADQIFTHALHLHFPEFPCFHLAFVGVQTRLALHLPLIHCFRLSLLLLKHLHSHHQFPCFHLAFVAKQIFTLALHLPLPTRCDALQCLQSRLQSCYSSSSPSSA